MQFIEQAGAGDHLEATCRSKSNDPMQCAVADCCGDNHVRADDAQGTPVPLADDEYASALSARTAAHRRQFVVGQLLRGGLTHEQRDLVPSRRQGDHQFQTKFDNGSAGADQVAQV